jgi:hypothetical protein
MRARGSKEEPCFVLACEIAYNQSASLRRGAANIETVWAIREALQVARMEHVSAEAFETGQVVENGATLACRSAALATASE